MHVTAAMNETLSLLDALMLGLKPEHKTAPTPCAKWTVHDLVEHMCDGGHMIAGLLEQAPPPPEDAPKPDHLADGPVKGWAGTREHLRSAATRENIEAVRPGPFGEVPGAVPLGLIVADHAIHAWDLAAATDQPLTMSDELAVWALETMRPFVPDDARTGDPFGPELPVSEDASPLERLLGFTGRQG